MRDPTKPEIGENLRRLRKNRGMSLRTMAESAELSPSFISQVERGMANASIDALLRLSAALGVSLGRLLTQGSSPVVLGLAQSRQALTTGGYVEFVLSQRESELFEVYTSTYAPGFREKNFRTHGDSEEFVYVMSGRVSIEVEDRAFTLGPGDSLEYYSSMQHRVSNLDDEVAQLLWVIGPPTPAPARPSE